MDDRYHVSASEATRSPQERPRVRKTARERARAPMRIQQRTVHHVHARRGNPYDNLGRERPIQTRRASPIGNLDGELVIQVVRAVV